MDKPGVVLRRHRVEPALMLLAWVLTLLAFALAVAFFIWGDASLSELGLTEAERRDFSDPAALLLLLPLLPLLLWLQRGSIEDEMRARCLEVEAAQLPELHQRLVELSTAMGLEKAPDLLVGATEMPKPWLPAFVAAPRSIVMTAEMAAFSGDDLILRDFWLAREVAKRRLGHDKIGLAVLAVIPRLLVLPGTALSRAHVYAVDAMAESVLPDGARPFLLFLAYGKTLSRSVDQATCLEGWRKRSRLSSDQLTNETPLLYERYLAIDRLQRARAEGQPVVVDGRLF